MSLETMRSKVERVIELARDTQYPGMPIQFENVPFRPPTVKYISVHILDGTSIQANLGDNAIIRYPGIVQITCLVPDDKGKAIANDLANFFGNTLKRKQYDLTDNSKLKFRTPTYNTLGSYTGFFRIAVTVPYWRDEPN